MTDVLIVGDTDRSAELRHEIPIHIGDPFLYAEVDGRRVAVVWSVEGDRIAAVDPTIDIVPSEMLPSEELHRAGVDYYEVLPTLTVQMVESLGVTSAVVPRAFPLQYADKLRAAGIELVVGDVISMEPGLYRQGFGGVRLEDVVVVTDDGCDTITRYPYSLDPVATAGATAR
jgi:Metallopeptidase family M24